MSTENNEIKVDRDYAAGSGRARKRKRFPHGNYTGYYTTRYGPVSEDTQSKDTAIGARDPRLGLLQRSWFEGKKCLDIGCNEGDLTLAIVRDFRPRKMALASEVTTIAERAVQRAKKATNDSDSSSGVRSDVKASESTSAAATSSRALMPRSVRGGGRPAASAVGVSQDERTPGAFGVIPSSDGVAGEKRLKREDKMRNNPKTTKNAAAEALVGEATAPSAKDSHGRNTRRKLCRIGNENLSDVGSGSDTLKYDTDRVAMEDVSHLNDEKTDKGRRSTLATAGISDHLPRENLIKVGVGAFPDGLSEHRSGRVHVADEAGESIENDSQGGRDNASLVVGADRGTFLSGCSVVFRHEDFVVDAHGDCGYDVICLFSVVKWMHLNGGDDALRDVFMKAYALMRPGGRLVLEPQPWKSYRKSARKHGSLQARANVDTIQLRPNDFPALLTGKVGFRSWAEVGVPGEGVGGFAKRRIHVFIK